MLFTPIFARGAVKLAKLALAWLGGSRQLSSVTVIFSLTFKTSKLECCVLSIKGGNIIGVTFRVVILRVSLVAEDIMTWGKGVAASLKPDGVRVSMCSRSCWIRDLSPPSPAAFSSSVVRALIGAFLLLSFPFPVLLLLLIRFDSYICLVVGERHIVVVSFPAFPGPPPPPLGVRILVTGVFVVRRE